MAIPDAQIIWQKVITNRNALLIKTAQNTNMNIHEIWICKNLQSRTNAQQTLGHKGSLECTNKVFVSKTVTFSHDFRLTIINNSGWCINVLHLKLLNYVESNNYSVYPLHSIMKSCSVTFKLHFKSIKQYHKVLRPSTPNQEH